MYNKSFSSSNSDASTQFTWKRSANNWDDRRLEKRSKYVNTEETSKKNHFYSDQQEETGYQRYNHFSRDYYKSQYYTNR